MYIWNKWIYIVNNYSFYRKNEVNSFRYGNVLVTETALECSTIDLKKSYIFATKIFDLTNKKDITSLYCSKLPATVNVLKQDCFNTDIDKLSSTIIKEVKVSEFEERKFQSGNGLQEFLLSHSSIEELKGKIKEQLNPKWRVFLKSFFKENQVTFSNMKGIILNFIENTSYNSVDSLSFAKYINTIEDLKRELSRSISVEHIKNSFIDLSINQNDYIELPNEFYNEFSNVVVEVCINNQEATNEILRSLIGELNMFSEDGVENLENLLYELGYDKKGKGTQALDLDRKKQNNRSRLKI